MEIDIKKYLKEFKIGTKKMFKEFFNKETNKKQRANMWTFARLVTPFITTIICIITLFVTNTLPLLIAAATLTGFGALTDYFDGKSARKYNSSSEYGKRLDQIADKVFSGMLGISLSILNPMFLITLFGETIISTINIAYKSKYPEIDISSSKIGRIKEWPLFITLGLGFISSLNPVLDVITKIMTILTFSLQLMTAGSYIAQNEKEIKKQKKETIYPNTLEIDIEEKELEKEKEKIVTKENRIQELKQYKNELLTTNNEKNKVYKLK